MRLESIRAEGSPSKELFSYLGPVYAYVVRRIGSAAHCEDITSEVFAVALQSRKMPSDPLPWLYGIARRKVADAYRKRTVRKEESLDSAASAFSAKTHDQVVQDESSARLRAMVDGLDFDQREAVLLFYVEELTAKQVAQSMGRSESAVNSLLQRARFKLRESGREYFVEDPIQ